MVNTDYHFIQPGQTIGILGGGQLGKMMAVSAKQMGYRVVVLDPVEDCPAAQVSDEIIVAPYDDVAAAKELVTRADVVTYEFENVDLEMATFIEQEGYLPQTSELLSITQDRLNEKATLTEAGLRVAPYQKVETKDDLKRALIKLGFPSVLKTVRGGYDGKGQLVLRSESDVPLASELLDGQHVLVLEQWVPFIKELSVMVVRNTSGVIKTYPVSENRHVHNILHHSLVPADVSDLIQKEADLAARRIAESLGLIGALGVELFLTKDGTIYVNELAPRPHNSGHYTIEACEFSQFEQHIRAICGLPLGPADLLKKVVMVNILGQHMPGLLKNLPKLENAHLHLYGKTEAKQNRKMGHLTVLTEDMNETLKWLDNLGIWTDDQTNGGIEQ
jgi:5-(carboxyamino)imidazole ribonucleotide synthase